MAANMLTFYRFISLSNTELGENSAQNIFLRRLANNFAEAIQTAVQIDRHKVWRHLLGETLYCMPEREPSATQRVVVTDICNNRRITPYRFSRKEFLVNC